MSPDRVVTYLPDRSSWSLLGSRALKGFQGPFDSSLNVVDSWWHIVVWRIFPNLHHRSHSHGGDYCLILLVVKESIHDLVTQDEEVEEVIEHELLRVDLGVVESQLCSATYLWIIR